jgi:hypothetical protein
MIPETDPADKIIMQGVHVELTAALQQAIRDKFAVLLRHNDHILRINVRLQHDQTRGRVPRVARAGQRGRCLHGQGQTEPGVRQSPPGTTTTDSRHPATAGR